MPKQTALLIKPTLEEVKRQGTIIGLPPRECENFLFYYQSNGWRVGKNPMKCWRSALAGWKNRYEEKLERSNVPRMSGADKIVWQRELERVLAAMQSIKASYSENQNWSKEDRGNFAKLRERREELKKLLGVMI